MSSSATDTAKDKAGLVQRQVQKGLQTAKEDAVQLGQIGAAIDCLPLSSVHLLAIFPSTPSLHLSTLELVVKVSFTFFNTLNSHNLSLPC